MKERPKHSSTLPPSHEKVLPRLNRIAGQVDGVKKMIKEQRYCPDILIQLHAIRSAVRNLEVQILDSHLCQCVVESFQSQDHAKQQQKIEEIRTLLKRFG